MGSKQKDDSIPKDAPKKKLKIGRIIAVLGILIYCVFFIHAFFGQHLKTYIIDYGNMEDSTSAEGYVIREEEVISSHYSRPLEPVRDEGERVAKGSVVATVFKQSAEQVEKDIAGIEKKIQSAIKDQEKNKLGKMIFTEDIKKIDEDTETKMYELCSLINDYDFEKVVQIKNDINNNLRKKAEINGEYGPANQYIKNLENEKKTYEVRLSSLKEDIKTDRAGVVSYNIDGLENVLLPDKISSLNISQLNGLDETLARKQAVTLGAFKIVNNFEAYICIILEDKAKINGMKVNQKAWLRFLGSDDELVPTVISNISKESDGRALVTFKIYEKVESLLNSRKIKVDVVWSTNSGLKMPVSSLIKQKFLSAVIEDEDKIKDIKSGEEVNLKLNGVDEKPVPAVVYSISTVNGKKTLTFKPDKTIGNLQVGQQINVGIQWMVLPEKKKLTDVLATCEERDGVMIVKSNYTRFREVVIDKRDNEYAVIDEASSISSKGVSLYDEIILNGSNVEEGRQVRKWNF